MASWPFSDGLEAAWFVWVEWVPNESMLDVPCQILLGLPACAEACDNSTSMLSIDVTLNAFDASSFLISDSP